MVLFDEQNRHSVSYQIPDLPEVDCLYEGSELSREGSVIKKGILCGEKTGERPIFRLKGAEEGYIMASLEFVESAYRREVTGMGIEEFVVRYRGTEHGVVTVFMAVWRERGEIAGTAGARSRA